MKNIYTLIILCLLSVNCLSAQLDSTNSKNEKMQTLFDNDEIVSGGYGAFEMRLTPIRGESGIIIGGRGGWILNSSFSIGGAGYGLVTNHKSYSKTADSTYYNRLGYGGLFFEYINSSNKAIHFTVNTLIGAGLIANGLKGSTNLPNDPNHFDITVDENSTFFIIEPGITADINVMKWFRIGLGASYRLILSDVSITNTVKSDIQSFSLNLIFKFGIF